MPTRLLSESTKSVLISNVASPVTDKLAADTSPEKLPVMPVNVVPEKLESVIVCPTIVLEGYIDEIAFMRFTAEIVEELLSDCLVAFVSTREISARRTLSILPNCSARNPSEILDDTGGALRTIVRSMTRSRTVSGTGAGTGAGGIMGTFWTG